MPLEVPETHPEDTTGQRRAFVVVGMHRSGTSAMTRTLSLLGAALPKQLMPAVADNNEVGFWEPQPVADLNDEILQALDSEWDDVFAFREHQYLSNFDHFYFGRALEMLEDQFNGSEVIVLKDPRISVLTQFWDRALRQGGYTVHYVVMVRNPLEVAESLRARDGFPREKSFLLWSSYMIAVERDTRAARRTFVSYDQLMDDWRAVRSRIENDAGIPLPRDTAAAAIEIDRFLDRRLHHHEVTGAHLVSRSDIPEQLKSLYGIFSEACEGADVDKDALDALRTELENLESLVGPLVADLRGSTRSLSNKIAELSEASASERERAESLQEQLAAERRSSASHEARVAELSEQLTTLRAERDRLMADAEEKARSISALSQRLDTAEAERAGLQKEAESSARSVLDLEERIAVLEGGLDEARAELAATQQLLGDREDRLAQQSKEVASLTDTIGKVRRDAEAAAKANESKLNQRFHEIGTLTNLLREQEERGDRADEHLSWLLAITERLANEPRWWRLLPKSWGRRRTLRRLRNAGLFDGDAYLQRYPDVAAIGRDPLDHYLLHGYEEGRSRAF